MFTLESKTELSVAKTENYIWGRGTSHRKSYTGRGDTAHTFLMGGTNGVGENIC